MAWLYLLLLAFCSANAHPRNTTLTLAYLHPWLDRSSTTPGTLAATRVASQTIQQRGLLNDFEINFETGQERCDGRLGIQLTVDIWRRTKLDGIIGAGCSVVCEPVSLLAAAWNLPVVSYGCASNTLSDKKEYPTFARTTGGYISYVPSLMALVETFNWTRVGILLDVVDLYRDTARFLQQQLEDRGIKVFYRSIAATVSDGKVIAENMKKLRSAVLDLRKNTKVILVLLYGADTRNFLVTTYEEGMHDGEHVFCGMEVYPDLQVTPVYKPNVGPEIWEGWMVVAPADIAGPVWVKFREDVVTAFHGPEFKDIAPLYSNMSINKVNIYAGLVHDAVLAWAYGVNKTLEQEHSPQDGFRVAKNIFGLTFEGITGTVVIDEKGDRKPNCKFQMVQRSQMVTILEWTAADARLHKVYKANDPDDWSGLLWPGNGTTPPSGVPSCGWDEELCPQESQSSSIVIIIVVVLGTFLFSTLLACFVVRTRYKKQMQGVELCIVSSHDIELLGDDTKTSFRTLRNRGTIHTPCNAGQTCVGRYNNETVAVKNLGDVRFSVKDHIFLQELKALKQLQHDNLTVFVGLCVDPSCLLLVSFASRGSLQDVLRQGEVNLTWDFKLSIVTDITQGMKYLHSSLGPHGHLSSSNCVIDSRWTCKVTDFGLGSIRHQRQDQHRLWRAPELLRQESVIPTKKGDVFSFGIIVQEVVLESDPYSSNVPLLEPDEILARVKEGRTIYRPTIPTGACSNDWVNLMTQCWSEEPNNRPTFIHILTLLRSMNGGKSLSLVDNMILRLENHTRHLESIVYERSEQLSEEKSKMEGILTELLPRSVFHSLKIGDQVCPETFNDVTVYFSDIVGFTRISAASTPMQVVQMLNSMYTLFDEISIKYNVFKVATIGDAYFVASGVPVRNRDHASEIADMAIELLRAAKGLSVSQLIQHSGTPQNPEHGSENLQLRIPENQHSPKHSGSKNLQLRIGIHTGECVAGVIGTKMPRYLLFGDTVDLASCLESSGQAMRIHVSAATAKCLRSYKDRFHLVERGMTSIKGFGVVLTYWLLD